MIRLTLKYLEGKKPNYLEQGYPVPKWIQFSEQMIKQGWEVAVYPAKTTVSKYIYINKNETSLKICFSNHKANNEKETFKDCDYYVGIGNNEVMITERLIEIINQKYINEKSS